MESSADSITVAGSDCLVFPDLARFRSLPIIRARDSLSPSHGGFMADKTTQLVLDALGHAAAEPAGLPLYASKGFSGLFTANAGGKQAAQCAKDDGLLRVLRTEPRGKTTHEILRPHRERPGPFAEPGQSQGRPRRPRPCSGRPPDPGRRVGGPGTASPDQLRRLADYRGARLTASAKTGRSASPAHSGNGCDAWLSGTTAYLSQWQASGASEDCPLPDLYRQAKKLVPHLSIGHFHDGLRRLHDQEHIYLHPWTGPLYDIPEPPYALLIGHEIAYYASVRPGK